jgi:hypothetical protein
MMLNSLTGFLFSIVRKPHLLTPPVIQAQSAPFKKIDFLSEIQYRMIVFTPILPQDLNFEIGRFSDKHKYVYGPDIVDFLFPSTSITSLTC